MNEQQPSGESKDTSNVVEIFSSVITAAIKRISNQLLLFGIIVIVLVLLAPIGWGITNDKTIRFVLILAGVVASFAFIAHTIYRVFNLKSNLVHNIENQYSIITREKFALTNDNIIDGILKQLRRDHQYDMYSAPIRSFPYYLPSLFHRKTFDEPVPECEDLKSRLRSARQTRIILRRFHEDAKKIFSDAKFDLYKNLESELEGYGISLAKFVLKNDEISEFDEKMTNKEYFNGLTILQMSKADRDARIKKAENQRKLICDKLLPDLFAGIKDSIVDPDNNGLEKDA